MRLIIVRHGEAEHNVKALMVAHGPSRLTEKGRAQVQRVAERLRGEHLDVAYSSHSERAVHTAQGILSLHPGVELVIDDLLRERVMGEMEGKTREEFIADAKASGVRWFEHRPKGGESMLETQTRAQQFMEKTRERYRGQTVLLVSHGGFIRALLAYLLKQNYETDAPMRVLNAAVTILQLRDDELPITHTINDTAHLDESTLSIGK